VCKKAPYIYIDKYLVLSTSKEFMTYWVKYIEGRAATKTPCTELGAKRTLNKLATWAKAERAGAKYASLSVLEAIEAKWRDCFRVKDLETLARFEKGAAKAKRPDRRVLGQKEKKDSTTGEILNQAIKKLGKEENEK